MNAHARPHARPNEGTATARVWELADAITAEKGRRARRREVVAAYVAEGGNANTGSTQFYYWNQATRRPHPKKERELPRGPLQLRIGEDGGLVLPAELTTGIELGPDRKVTAQLVDGELRLITPRVALRKLRTAAKALAPEGMAVVDDFIAEKRREAERE
jgi:hypothetical protein